jgi:hypothetical protein
LVAELEALVAELEALTGRRQAAASLDAERLRRELQRHARSFGPSWGRLECEAFDEGRSSPT